MAVNIEVKEGQTAEVVGPARISVTSDVPDSVKIDGAPVMPGGPAPGVPTPDPPTLTALEPNTAIAGDNVDVEMIVEGTGFLAGSVIVFNGIDEPTTFIDDTQVSTGVKPSLFVVPADCPVAVRNGGTLSNELTFSFTASARGGKSSRR
jgi:hypothetical protein